MPSPPWCSTSALLSILALQVFNIEVPLVDVRSELFPYFERQGYRCVTVVSLTPIPSPTRVSCLYPFSAFAVHMRGGGGVIWLRISGARGKPVLSSAAPDISRRLEFVKMSKRLVKHPVLRNIFFPVAPVFACCQPAKSGAAEENRGGFPIFAISPFFDPNTFFWHFGRFLDDGEFFSGQSPNCVVYPSATSLGGRVGEWVG